MKKENSAKIIFHIDMNAFFCSVACNLNPALRGKVFAIGRENSYRGVISTASYEARKLGIHSAMSLADAYKLIPDLMVIHIDYDHYNDYHNRFIKIIREYSKIVEVASIDECYVDMTEASKFKHPLVIANEIQVRILKEANLPCSIGIGPTMFLAKMASDMKKPLGITVLRKRDVEEKLYPLSIKEMFGIGKKTYPRLIDGGIKTIGNFVDPINKSKVIELVGENTYNYVINCVSGNSTNTVDPNRYAESSSISQSATFDVFLTSIEDILYELRKMAKSVHTRLIEAKSSFKTVTITLRDGDFKTITRSLTLEDYSNNLYDINYTTTELLEENYQDKPYRLVGVGVSNILPDEKLPKEYNLFTINDMDLRLESINQMIHSFQEKYGEKSLYRRKDIKKK
jgi:DNA polymerase-4